MIEPLEAVFWVLAALVVYVYAGYPILLALVRSITGGVPIRRGEGEPSVTFVVSAFNERAVIADKLRNTLAIDYPRARLEILVVSDASDDGTDDIVKGFASEGVKLLRMGGRGGKTLGLNAALEAATGEVVVFSDANAMYARDAVRKLVRNFSDASVGAVVGESTYEKGEAAAEHNEGLYWKYETAIKRLETDTGSVVGGDGAIYAIRRALYTPMRADALSDFVNPLQIVRAGHRCVYEPEARSFERAAADFAKEFRRKVRIVNRAWRATMSMPDVLNPLRHGAFALRLISHKLLRWLMPLMLAALLIVSIALAEVRPIYTVALWCQALFYALAAAGYLLRKSASLPRALAIPYYFCMVNVASAVGIVDAYLGKTYTTWTPPRADAINNTENPRR